MLSGVASRDGSTTAVVPQRPPDVPCPIFLALEPSRTARGQLDLCRAQDAHDRSDSRRELCGIGDSWLGWPFDQYRGGCVGWLDQLYHKSIGLSDRAGRQEPL